MTAAVRDHYRRVVRSLVCAVCEASGLTAEELLGGGSARRLARPRQMAYYLLRETTEVGTPTIGATFGGRDHSTVIHGIRAVEAALYRRDEWAVELLAAVVEAQRARAERARADEIARRSRRDEPARLYVDPYEMPPPCHEPDDAPTPLPSSSLSSGA